MSYTIRMKSVHIFGVRVDDVTMDEAIDHVEKWIKGSGKHYVVTPNVEFIMKAQDDPKFLQTLNNSDLAIPDSAHLSWALKNQHLSVVTGTDLMDKLCKEAVRLGWSVGLIGGGQGVATKVASKYPGLKVVLAESGGVVEEDGTELTHPALNQKMDLLFVAFGQGKQEKWIVRHLGHLPVKVAIGVGGAFDYLSGSVPRAPLWMRNLGLEWLFRLVTQPWRIKRYPALVRFILRCYFSG